MDPEPSAEEVAQNALTAEENQAVPEDASPEEPASNEETEETEGTEPEANSEDSTESFYDLDTSAIPDDLDPREWAAQRHKEMQSAFTRKTQQLAEERKQAQQAQQILEIARDPTHPQHAEALDYLGLEVDDGGEEEVEEPDPQDQLAERLARIEETMQQATTAQQQAAREEAEIDYVAEELEQISTLEGRELEGEEIEFLHGFATANRKEDGTPNVERAYQVLKATINSHQKRHIGSKKAPRSPGAGPAARKQFDPTDATQLEDAAEAAAEAALANSR